jgi:DNA repair exonuclease SbcCD ATPase subunit
MAYSSRGRRILAASLVSSLLGLLAPACDTMYYKTMKRFGVEKRDILVKRVREARKSQEEAKQDFQTALERFNAVVDVEGGRLEEKYETLNRELERSEDRAREVHDRIKAVRDVSNDLFKEWQKELDQYSDRRLRTESERELRETKRRAESLIAAMERAEGRITPVLKPLRDRVLFLKHNLNARAIGALNRELVSVRTNVDSLVEELTQSINEADAFIKDMDTGTESGPPWSGEIRRAGLTGDQRTGDQESRRLLL